MTEPGQRTVAIVQARMGSERLPGKVLLDIAGRSMLERVVSRLKRARLVDETVVATTRRPADDLIADAAAEIGAEVVRGSEDDVLDRYRQAALQLEADVCVRVSGDSPFVDPGVTDEIIARFRDAMPPVDYASNKLEPSFPLGLDVEVFSRAALERSWSEARAPWERTHVTPYIYRNPDKFQLLPVVAEQDFHHMRWTVDTAEDLEFARAVHARLRGRDDFDWLEVIALLEREPELMEINRRIRQREPEQG